MIILAFALAVAIPAQAITFGQPDGNLHPNVGGLIIQLSSGEKDLICTGTLISPTVFLTADHCVNFLPSLGIAPDQVWVTFDPVFSQYGTFYPATYYTNPNSWHDMADPQDVAVLVLKAPITNIAPARLPTAGLLDQMKAAGALKGQSFTAVGYGTVRDDKTGGFHALFWDPTRRYVGQTYSALTKSWLKISMNPSTGDGGTCYGDSGGPHFLGDSDLVVALTVTGDAPCRATDVDYRLDNASARAFLGQFVTLP
jgi:V8-like Glu-specific endopeptidase